MTALKVLALVDAEGRPTSALEQLVMAEGDERRRVLRSVLEANYAPVFALDLSRATRAQFHEAFQSFGTKEGVLAKCEAFFIQAAQDAGIELSAFILARRHVTRRGSAAGRSRAPAAERAPEPRPAQPDSGQRSITEMILAKYPDFDPSWSSDAQARWYEGLEGITRLLARGGLEGDAPSGGSESEDEAPV